MSQPSKCPYFGAVCNANGHKNFECAYPYFYEICYYYNDQKRKDEEPMDNKTIEKTLNMADNISKIAANLSEKKDPPKTKPEDINNKATTGSQSVNVMLDTGKKREPKPVEKHIHTFPENRALTTEECELDLKKAQMEYELKKVEQQHLIECDKLNWKHQIEQERKAEKRGKIRRIIGGLLVTAGLAGLGYSIYADYRDNKCGQVGQKPLPETNPINAEGSVK